MPPDDEKNEASDANGDEESEEEDEESDGWSDSFPGSKHELGDHHRQDIDVKSSLLQVQMSRTTWKDMRTLLE